MTIIRVKIHPIRQFCDHAMCGVKRVILNGMRGEHTTILTDGIPLHTMIAGFYAVDAIATTGVKRIEVARGAGASLIAPEAIGGTINVVSKESEQSGLDLDVSLEEDEGYLASGLGTLVSDEGRHRFSVVTRLDRQDRVDGDNNLPGSASGEFLTWSRGFLPEEKLRAYLRTTGQISCQE